MSLFFIVVLGFCCLILTLGSAHNLPPPYSKRSYHTNNSSISFSANNATNSTGAGKTPNSASSTSQTADFSITSQPVLLPAVHWNHDAGNIQNLVPQQDQKFYYSAGGNNGRIPCSPSQSLIMIVSQIRRLSTSLRTCLLN